MNFSAYLATGQLIALMQGFSRIKVQTHGQELIPEGSIIFVVNHFTRLETLLLPYHIYTHTRVPVWSLADHSFFNGRLGGLLEKVGAVSTRNPDRDRLIVKSLLTGEANWIIYPEGLMVKNKEMVTGPSFLGISRGGRRHAHSGAATLALRTEFYRQRLRRLLRENPAEADRLRDLFRIENLAPVLAGKTWIVPINLTYYPLRAQENVLSLLADRFARNVSDRYREELLTEGTMFFDGVDIDIRFGAPLAVADSLAARQIRQDMYSQRQINFDDELPSLPVMRAEATKLMHRFMSDIYRMTTVNHDHLFASLLKALPFNRISEKDFRRRVFLLTDLVPDKTLVFCHQSLETPQIALLTDDRYHKFRDFLALARESGVVRSDKGVLLRNSFNLTADSEFHRIRIENPLGVAANEVQPLTGLKRQVRWLAWLPELLIRHKVIDVLQRLADDQFDTDYTLFQLQNESKPRSVGAPYLLKGVSRRIGVVLVHGFLAAPEEMRELATYLHGRGYWVYSVRLRGHGTSPVDLATRTSRDWVESVDLGYALMSSICRRVVVGGFSFGGGLALDVAARMDSLAGVFAVAPPFRLQDITTRFASVVTTWNRIMENLHLSGAAKEFFSNNPERPQINYERVPVAALLELELFMKGLEPRLADVKAPTLVMQAQGDPVVNHEGTALLFNLIKAEQKRYVSLDFNRHGIIAGEGSEVVHGAIGAFIEQL